MLGEIRAGTTAAAVDDALALLTLGAALEAVPTLWAAQNEAARLWRAAPPCDRDILAPLMTALGFASTALAIPREKG